MSSRRQSVDVYRGLAILAMIAYHAIWDLNYYGFISVGIGVDAVWFVFQRGIVTLFLLLVGAGLWLGHEKGVDWPRFWRREALLVLSALGVSAITWFQFGEYFAYFGILHLIALSSVMALPLIRAPIVVTLSVALFFLLMPALASSDLFNTRWLAWIGFFTMVPETADLVPLFPWFGVVLVGMVIMRLFEDTPAFLWESHAWPVKALALLGRWSLIIYLVHQPVLFGVISLFVR